MYLLIFLYKMSYQYYKSSVVGNRTLAMESCKLARPDVIFSDKGNKVNISKYVLENKQRAWIGYTNTYDIFHYIGCVRKTDIVKPYTKFKTTNDPGQCYSACKHSTMFGLRNSNNANCFCFETDEVRQVKSTRNQCDDPCDNKWFACGNSGSFSVYKKAQIETQKTYSDQCLAYSQLDVKNVWVNCDITRNRVCIKGENDTSPLNTESTTWERAMDSCFHKDEYPISNRSILSAQLNYNYWIAYINTLYISDSEDEPTTNVSKYGYVERNEDVINLRFTNNSNDEMIALCNEEPTPSTTRTTTSTTTMQKPEVTRSSKASILTEALTTQPPQTEQVTGDNKKPTPSTTRTTTSTTTMQKTEVTRSSKASTLTEALTNQPPQTKQVTGDNKTGVYIAVPLVISACVCVAVVVVLCYRKKRRQQPEKTEHKEILPRQNPMYNYVEDEVCYMNTVDQNDGVSMALENSTNNLKELRQDETNPKLNSQTNSMNTGNARGIYDFAQEFRDAVPNMSENSYFVLEKVEKVSDVYSKVGTYVDLSPDRNTIPSDHATNTYNMTADYNRDLDNYDHIGAAKSKTANEDGHYNTTFSDDKGESFYDTTNLSGPRHAVNDETYDTTKCPNDYDLANNTFNKTGIYVNANCKDVYSFAQN